jgi:hypothetical protein
VCHPRPSLSSLLYDHGLGHQILLRDHDRVGRGDLPDRLTVGGQVPLAVDGIDGCHNYGQGSSREQAALAPLYLGIRAVIAKSFARIHRQNLIAQSILPLVFVDEADYEHVRQGDTWSIDAVRETVASGRTTLTATTDGGRKISLRAQLLERERETLLAGGTITYLRSGGQKPIGIVKGDSALAEWSGPESRSFSPPPRWESNLEKEGLYFFSLNRYLFTLVKPVAGAG